MDFPIGADPVHGCAVLRQHLDRLVDSDIGHVFRVDLAHSKPQPVNEHDITLGVAPQAALGSQDLLEGVDWSPAELRQKLDARLLDVPVLRARGSHYATCLATNASRSSVEISKIGRASCRDRVEVEGG